MKKFLLISAVCAVACAFSGCSLFQKENPQNTQYDELTSMLNIGYSKITITVNNTIAEEGVTLKSEYIVKYFEDEIMVIYTVERFVGISLENPADGPVTTYEGRAKIADGKITGGEEVGLTADIASLSHTFKPEYFKNVTLTGVYIDADVKNASAFLGADITCTDMHLYAEFLNIFYNMKITYSQNGNTVEYIYEFNR